MATYFDTLPKVMSIDDYSNIENLLNLSKFLIDFCDIQGKCLYMVKVDVEGNRKKISNAALKYNLKTVRELLDKESTISKVNRNSGTQGVLWLTRTMELIFAFLDGILQYPDRDSHEIGRIAYSETLMKHHSSILRKIFYLGLGLFPKKSEFLLRLAFDNPGLDDLVLQKMSLFTSEYKPIVKFLRNLLMEYGLENYAAPDSHQEV